MMIHSFIDVPIAIHQMRILLRWENKKSRIKYKTSKFRILAGVAMNFNSSAQTPGSERVRVLYVARVTFNKNIGGNLSL